MKINLYHTCVKSKSREPVLIAKKLQKKEVWKKDIFSKKEESIKLLDYYYGENIKHFNNIEKKLNNRGLDIKRFIICWATGIQPKDKKIVPYSLEEIGKKERAALFYYLNNHKFDEKILNIFFLKPEDIIVLLPILPKNKIIITSNTRISRNIKGNNLVLYDIKKAKVLVKEGGPILISKYPYYLLSNIDKSKEITFGYLKKLSKELLGKVKERKSVKDDVLENLIKKNYKTIKSKTALVSFLRNEKKISIFIDRFNKIYKKVIGK